MLKKPPHPDHRILAFFFSTTIGLDDQHRWPGSSEWTIESAYP
jgi:hypothetical protein